jgi:CubicO group peptidase (beta-lactamase class C family)
MRNLKYNFSDSLASSIIQICKIFNQHPSMRKRWVLLFLLLSMANVGFSQTPTVKKLADYMEAQSSISHFSGTILIVRNDTILLHKAYGLADREWNVPNAINTKYGLASITKQFTAIAILQLIEKGKLSLDDKLGDFYKDFPTAEQISIHMMLTHTAGLALDFEELYLDRTTMTRDSALVYIKKLPLQFKPGENLAYSNVGYFLLAQIVEKVSGLSYSEYLKRNIFDVIGMKESGLNSNEAIIPNLSRAYFKTDAGLVKNPYINWDLNIGLDGMYSTAADLYRLDRALYGNSLLSAHSKKMMFTQYNKAFPDNGFLDSYGYGVFINPYFNHGHEMLTHSGGYFGVTTTMDRYPKDNMFITVLSNNESESHWIAYGLAGIVFGKEVENPYVHIEKVFSTQVLSAFTGKYGAYEFIEKNGKLYIKNTNTELVRESVNKFFRKDNPDRTFEFLGKQKNRKRLMILTRGGVKDTFNYDGQ